MDPLLEAVFYLGVPLSLILLGLVGGRHNERQHLRQLALRAHRLRHMLVTDLRTPSADVDPAVAPALITGEVVIASDYLKTFLANLRGIFGGELTSYVSLVTRAREEARLRLLEQAQRQGYDAVCNLRLSAADIGGNTGRQGIPMVAMLASGTGYRRAAAEHPYR